MPNCFQSFMFTVQYTLIIVVIARKGRMGGVGVTTERTERLLLLIFVDTPKGKGKFIKPTREKRSWGIYSISHVQDCSYLAFYNIFAKITRSTCCPLLTTWFWDQHCVMFKTPSDAFLGLWRHHDIMVITYDFLLIITLLLYYWLLLLLLITILLRLKHKKNISRTM